ncbi:MAG TPA: MgtC/SapB family protein [Syntrophothermus lipocalidus]|nr:MgtC/SapB family protein [Syntrophothermus lipocalidus]
MEIFGLFFLQMLMCVVIGTGMGAMTKSRTKSTGPRTMILITIGAALVTIVSAEFFKGLGNPWFADPGRIAAQVVSALGFMGTGLIWITDSREMKRLWTAAAVWVSAILGMLIGMGRLLLSGAVLIMVIAVVFGSDYYVHYRDNSSR